MDTEKKRHKRLWNCPTCGKHWLIGVNQIMAERCPKCPPVKKPKTSKTWVGAYDLPEPVKLEPAKLPPPPKREIPLLRFFLLTVPLMAGIWLFFEAYRQDLATRPHWEYPGYQATYSEQQATVKAVWSIGALTLFCIFPAWLAWVRRHPRAVQITILSISLGWTIIGGIIALMWASWTITKKIEPSHA